MKKTICYPIYRGDPNTACNLVMMCYSRRKANKAIKAFTKGNPNTIYWTLKCTYYRNER